MTTARRGSGGDPVVAVERLRKVYGEGNVVRAALDGVSLTVEKGEFVVILGHSGSGKSTLLGIAGGLDRAYEGKVALFGQDVAALSDKALARLRGQKIGFVFQAFHLLAHLSVLDNVLAPALFDAGPRDRSERALTVLDRLGIKDRADDLPAQLSGGQRQRVAIARALLQSPELLLCDEPTGNLDADTGERTIALFRDLHRDGPTVLAVTHEERLANAATRVIRLKDGRIVDETSRRAADADATEAAAISNPARTDALAGADSGREGARVPVAASTPVEPVSAGDPEGP